MQRDRTGLTSCCFVIPIQPGAIVISVLGVLSGGAFGVVYARNIYEGISGSPDNMLLNAVPYFGMVAWMILALISFFGCWASWTAKPRLVAIYFWSLVAHYIFDLIFLVGTVFVTLQGVNAPEEQCIIDATNAGYTNVESLCSKAMDISTMILIGVLGSYKLFSTYTTYVIFLFKRWTITEAEDAEKQAQQQRQMSGPDGTANWSRFDD